MARGRRRKAPRQGVTLSVREMRKQMGAEPEDDLTRQLRAERPKTREECVDGPRPCPWVSCRHHLYLDLNVKNGSLLLPYAEVDLSELPNTCSLDVAESGPLTLDEVGEVMRMSRERARQLEARAMRKIRQLQVIRDLAPERNYKTWHPDNDLFEDDPE